MLDNSLDSYGGYWISRKGMSFTFRFVIRARAFPYAIQPKPLVGLDQTQTTGSFVLMSLCFGFLQAECNTDPHQFFEFLYNHGIGKLSSPLYIAWAEHLEGQGQLQHASAVFRRGIHNQAEPKELLQEQYRQFENEALCGVYCFEM